MINQYATIEDCENVMRDRMLSEASLGEWGTFNGNTLNRLIGLSEKVGKPFKNIIFYDSCQGLPMESDEIPLRLRNPDWIYTAFSIMRDYDLKTVEEAAEWLKKRIVREDAQLVVGFFEDTCNEEEAKRFPQPLGFVHADCDIFLSSRTVAQFLFKHKLVTPGCIWRWDDWDSCNRQCGNQKAHYEAEEQYQVEFERIYRNVFIVHDYK